MKQLPAISPETYRNLQIEILCTEIMRQGVSFDQIRILMNSNFKKSYHGDIEKVSPALTKNHFREELQVVANRNGIYDRLPEGLFHQPLGNSRVTHAAAMKDEHQRYRVEENAARNFFQPYDQEMFRYHLLVEQAEQALSINLLRGNVNEQWNHFWDLPADLPREAGDALARILPWCFLISGNLALTTNALQFILGKEIHSASHWQHEHFAGVAPFALGGAMLGTSTILGNKFQMPMLHWTFTVADLSAKERALYPNQQPLGKLLQRFTDIFIPIHICTTFELLPGTSDAAHEEEVLGFGFVI